MKVYFIRGQCRVTRKSRSSILVVSSEGNLRELNLRDIESLVVIGSKVVIESGVLSLLSRCNVPVAVVSHLGVSLAAPPIVTLDNEVRRRQYTLSTAERLSVMKNILAAKFRGYANILEYHRRPAPNIPEPQASSDSELLHWEAAQSNIFWDEILRLLPESTLSELRERYGFSGRRPRAKDPFNSAVSLLYAVLYALSTRSLAAAGFDPTYGFMHKTRYSTALTFDYSEMFKPIAVHAVVKVLREGKKLELAQDRYLTRESVRTVSEEFFKILGARIRGTNLTPYRQVYLCTHRLARHLRTGEQIRYTYSYNPARLKHPPQAG